MRFGLLLLLVFCPVLGAALQKEIAVTVLKGQVLTTNISSRIEVTDPVSGELTGSVSNGQDVAGWKLSGESRQIYAFFSDQKAASRLEISRSGNQLQISGVQKGKKVSRAVDIDATPWYSTFELAARSLLGTKQDELQFWMLNPESLDAMKMVVKNRGPETLKVHGRTYSSVKVEVTLAGIMGAFWKADYWIDQNGGFIRFKGLMGPPGSPEALIELLETRII